jgi:hypothetical protein
MYKHCSPKKKNKTKFNPEKNLDDLCKILCPNAQVIDIMKNCAKNNCEKEIHQFLTIKQIIFKSPYLYIIP